MRYAWIGLGVLVACGVAFSGWILSTVNASSGSADQQVQFTVEKGEGIRTMSNRLYEEQLITSRQAWTLYVIFSGLREDMKAGEYTLTRDMSGKDIAQTLSAGQVASNEARVTIPEGKRLDEIAALLEAKEVVSAEAFLAVAKRPATFTSAWTTDLFASKPATVDLEGYLFPDTYNFFRGSTAEAVIRRMVENTDTRLTPAIRAEITASGHSLHEILTMASILELELQTASDRAMAADLFWRRIAAGIAMQSDATVNYVTGKGRAQPSIDDTKVNSAYNTYQVRGLPPGPIGSPGMVSILAALRPVKNEYFYYLSAPNGQTIWARTFEEHVANKQKYLR